MLQEAENVNNVNVNIDKPGKLTMSFKKEHDENYFPFNMTSPFVNKPSKQKIPGLLNLLVSITPAAGQLFVNELLVHVDMNNGMVTMKEWEKLSIPQLKPVYRKLAELRKVGLLLPITNIKTYKELPKFTYMLNPYHVKPLKYKTAKKQWDSINGK